MSAEENKAALARAAASWNAGDFEGYISYFAPDTVVHNIPGVGPGRESIRGFYEGFWAAFPGSRLEVSNVMADGDRLAATFLIEGTHEGPFIGIPATGNPISFAGTMILRFADGKCAERWSHGDMLGLLQQIGAIPMPEAPTAA